MFFCFKVLLNKREARILLEERLSKVVNMYTKGGQIIIIYIVYGNSVDEEWGGTFRTRDNLVCYVKPMQMT